MRSDFDKNRIFQFYNSVYAASSSYKLRRLRLREIPRKSRKTRGSSQKPFRAVKSFLRVPDDN